jgi:hypothetical protein
MWNFLFDRRHRLDLCAELPRSEFRLLITPEVYEEIAPISNGELKESAVETVERCGIEQERYFGFRDSSLPIRKQQRTDGFWGGRLRTQKEKDFEEAQMQKRGEFRPPRKPTMTVSPSEADISVGARSSRAVILSSNKNAGPISLALYVL